MIITLKSVRYLSESMISPAMHGHYGLDPSINNQPLQFNANKGKAPMAIPGEDIDLRAEKGAGLCHNHVVIKLVCAATVR